MGDSAISLTLAIDGGGTRCRLALAQGRKVTRVEVGAANVSTDFDAAVREITKGLKALTHQCEIATDKLRSIPAFVGLAGVTGSEISDRLKKSLPLQRVLIDDDRPAALRGAIGIHDGAVAHCGTGSFFAGQAGGQMLFAGGWGPVLGDEASAQWVGTLALTLTLQSVDGRAPKSALTQELLSRFEGPAGIVRFAGSAPPDERGALAPLVTESAAAGDTVAVRIMQAGARHIEESVPAVGWRSGLPLCLTGGLGPCFAPYLTPEIQADLIAPAGQPIEGALALARDFAKELADGRL